jgi:hypothetical protein
MKRLLCLFVLTTAHIAFALPPQFGDDVRPNIPNAKDLREAREAQGQRAADQIASQPSHNVRSGERVRVQQMRQDGFCLSLETGEDFYPLYDQNDLSPDTFTIDPQFPQVTITLNGLAVDAMQSARGAKGNPSQWPIVFHGPMKACSFVNFSFNSFSADYIANRSDRIEIGPDVNLFGHEAISVESSNLKNLSVDSDCLRNTKNPFSRQNACVRLEYDFRSSQGSKLYILHRGRKLCAIDNRNLTNVELRVQQSEAHPMTCDDVDLYSSRYERAGSTYVTDTNIRTNNRTNNRIDQSVRTRVAPSNQDCGPYTLPVRVLSIDPSYGLSNTQEVAPRETILNPPDEVVIQPKKEKAKPKKHKLET